MRVEAVDERDVEWDELVSSFRVYFFRGAPSAGQGHATSTYVVSEAEFYDVARWAEEEAGADRMYAIGSVDTSRPSTDVNAAGTAVGIRWLVGADANDPVDDAHSRVVRAGMEARMGRRTFAADG